MIARLVMRQALPTALAARANAKMASGETDVSWFAVAIWPILSPATSLMQSVSVSMVGAVHHAVSVM